MGFRDVGNPTAEKTVTCQYQGEFTVPQELTMTSTDIHSSTALFSTRRTAQLVSRITACVNRLLAARAALRAEKALIDHLRRLDAQLLNDLGIDASALHAAAPRIKRFESID